MSPILAIALRPDRPAQQQIGAFGPEAHVEQHPERQQLVEQLGDLNLELNSINSQIAGLGDQHAAADLRHHMENLTRRAGVSA